MPHPPSHAASTNRLATESSPYLLQHAHNPVDWYPWGPEALERARREDKPIFLSIGYAACHWCHVMERESFENAEIARVMNRHFVCIKVDREERPDLDEIYMAAVQLLTGRGGWPMSVFLLPDLRPFFGGTYFPPEDRPGMPGFTSLLLKVAAAFQHHRAQMTTSAAQLAEAIGEAAGFQGGPGEAGHELVAGACEHLLAAFDPEHGGFGGAPKFPPSMELNLLLRRRHATADSRYLHVVERTLEGMAQGGMYDQIGGGFCRYSTDERWLVPHFEKMLYDNALLSRTYLAAFQATGKPFYAQIARETFEYVLRDLGQPGGGFASSEDADSEGEEGKFYVWTPNEVEQVLGREEGELACAWWDITRDGNFEGKNIPNVPVALAEFARGRKAEPAAVAQRLAAARAQLLTARGRRVRPGLDDKVLTSWNALMIQSLAQGAQVLGEPRWLDAAARAARFLFDQAMVGGRLRVTWRAGAAKLNAYLDEYAFLAAACLDLFEASFETAWLERAQALMRTTIEHFWDDADGTFFFTSDDHEKLIARTKAPYDGVIPSGNSEAARTLLRLAALTGDAEARARAERVLRRFTGSMAASARGFANMLGVLDFARSETLEVALVGGRGEAGMEALVRALFARYLPNKVVAWVEPGAADAAARAGQVPWLAETGRVQGKPAAYVCVGSVCRLPVTDAEEFGRGLAAAVQQHSKR
ncbi:MAG: thioredoxin domain-containing protein [Planctomycetes bacterium]|nr:thioredoxin domain-containing protein [Planctomycetota bacterium]